VPDSTSSAWHVEPVHESRTKAFELCFCVVFHDEDEDGREKHEAANQMTARETLKDEK
jgi:hypothetical protein